MPDPTDSKYSNSYDMFCRGEEIISGAQRIHDPELLAQRIRAHGVEIKGGLEDYVDAFKYGAMPQYPLIWILLTDTQRRWWNWTRKTSHVIPRHWQHQAQLFS
jgi:hypothetical protein